MRIQSIRKKYGTSPGEIWEKSGRGPGRGLGESMGEDLREGPGEVLGDDYDIISHASEDDAMFT